MSDQSYLLIGLSVTVLIILANFLVFIAVPVIISKAQRKHPIVK